MKTFEKIGIVGIIAITIAGAIFGAVISQSHGILAMVGWAVVGGIAGVFIALNAIAWLGVIINFLWTILGGSRNPAEKKIKK